MSTNNLYFAVLHSIGLTQRNLRDISPVDAEEYYSHLNTQKLLSIGFQMERASLIVDKKTNKIVEHVEQTLASV